MLNKKNTSLITLTLLIAIASVPKSTRASSPSSFERQVSSEQIARINPSENSQTSDRSQANFPWWILILVAFVPFLGWFLLGRNTQNQQKLEVRENFSTSLEPSLTNNDYGNNLDLIETENNSNLATELNFEDNTIMAATIAPNSDLTNKFNSQNNSFTEQISQTNLEQPQPITSVPPISDRESIESFNEIDRPSQLITEDTDNSVNNNVEQLSSVDPEIIAIDELESSELPSDRTANLSETNLNSEISQPSPIETDVSLDSERELVDFLEQTPTLPQENQELIEDKIGNITEWLEQLDLSSSFDEQKSFLVTENFGEHNNNFNESEQLNEIENGLDLESFEQLLFGDLERQEQSKNQS